MQGYLEKCPQQLMGRTFGEAAFYFPDATIFAIVQASRSALDCSPSKQQDDIHRYALGFPMRWNLLHKLVHRKPPTCALS